MSKTMIIMYPTCRTYPVQVEEYNEELEVNANVRASGSVGSFSGAFQLSTSFTNTFESLTEQDRSVVTTHSQCAVYQATLSGDSEDRFDRIFVAVRRSLLYLQWHAIADTATAQPRCSML